MYCPRCSQEQVSENILFCPRCGLRLDVIIALLSNQEESQKVAKSPLENLLLLTQNSPRPGLKLIFFSVVICPLIFIASYFFDSPLPFTMPLLIFLAGLSQTTYVYLFGSKSEAVNEKSLSKGLTASNAGSNINLLVTRLNKELQQCDGFSSLVIEGLMLELIAETSRNYVKVTETMCPQWLKNVEEFLQQQFSDQPTLTEIAASANVHPTHLARVFRQYHHCTVGEYLRKLRIEHSCQRLLTTKIPLSDIALEAGFYDQSHFSRCFKQIMGLTPTEYRTAHHAP